jgi:hypothetical protein
MIRILLGLLLVTGFSSVAAAVDSSPWLGLWRLEQRSPAGAAVYHVQVSSLGQSPDVRLYNADWERQRLTNVSIRSDILQFTWEVTGRPILARLEVRTNRLTGNWNLIHPQYSMDGRLEAIKVITQPDWDPSGGFSELQAADGLIDFTGFLLNSPHQTYEQFLRFWNSEVEPAFYPLLADLLYGTGVVEPDLRERQLRALYRQLQDPLFKSRARKVSGLYSSVHADLKRQLPEFSIKAAPITMPSMEGSAEGLLVLGGRIFVIIDIAALKESLETRLRYVLARMTLQGSVLSRHRGNDPGITALRTGLLAHMTSRLGYSEKPSDYLLSSEEALQQVAKAESSYREQLAAMLGGSFRPEDVRRFFEVAPRPGGYIGYHFVASLLQSRSLTEILEMETPAIYAELRSYLSSGQ